MSGSARISSSERATLACGKFREERLDLFRIGIVDPFELGAGLDQAVALAVDVAVVEVRGGKDEFAGLHHRARLALRRVVHAVGFLAHGCGRRTGRAVVVPGVVESNVPDRERGYFFAARRVSFARILTAGSSLARTGFSIRSMNRMPLR